MFMKGEFMGTIVYDSYTNKHFCVDRDLIITMQQKSINYCKNYLKKIELRKPFLQKLYEMYGRDYWNNQKSLYYFF